ncbi:MAG: hypothetical protein LUG56_06050 [Lachnospiraceae bacterium]|nr:hypothetical protein [Lachnospiraceae bacterium]
MLLRSDSMLMLLPLGAMALLGDFAGRGAYQKKGEWKWRSACAGATVVALLLGQAGNVIGYSSEEWAKYQRLNNAAVVLFDYYEFPEYEEVCGILEQYGVTETEYAAYRNYVNLEYDLSVECIEALAEYVQSSQSMNSVNAGSLLRESWEVLFSTNRMSINNLAGILWIGAIFTCIMIHKKEVFLPLGAVAVARTVVWSYLIYKGRLPDRVTRPLLFGEVVLLLLFLLRIWEWEKPKCGIRVLASGIGICFILWACIGAQRQLRYVQDTNAAQEVMMESFREVREYCDNHPENQYILDCNSFSNYIGTALGTTVSGEANYIYSGGWYSNSPNVLQWIENYLGDLEDADSSVYLIIYDWSGEADADGCGVTVQYLQEKTAKQPVLVETLTLANGGTYLVVRF